MNERLRPVELWQPEIVWETREDGSILVSQKGELAAYPLRISDRIAHWADVTPNKVWMAERPAPGAEGWNTITFGELLPRIRSIGEGLLDLGLSLEKPLVVLSGNSIAHALIVLGAQYVGIPTAALAPAYSLISEGYEKLFAIRDQITPGAVFAEDLTPFLPAIEAVFPKHLRLGVKGPGLVREWDELLSTPPSRAVDEANSHTGPDTIAKFMFTSGTTGTPKAVIQTQRMLCSNVEMATDCYAYFRHEPPVMLDWGPWNHVASGNKVFNITLYNGGTYYLDGGKPTHGGMAETIRNLHDVSPNWFFNVPGGYDLLIEAMRADKVLAEKFFRNLKMMMYAGAAMAQHTWEELEQIAVETTGERIFLSTSLGATETAPFALFNATATDAPGNIGIPARGLTLKLVPNDGKWEARIKGPSVTPGYWRDPKLTAEAYDEEGYYMLGDALRFAVPGDPSKGFYFDGRVAENFKLTTGTWVAVGPLRAKLGDALGQAVRDSVIVGEGRDTLGALLIPFRPAAERLVPGGEALDDEALFAHPVLREDIARRLAEYNRHATGSSMRVPRAIFVTEPLSIDRGELTDKGSINQRAVRSHRADLVEAIYAGDPRVILSAKPSSTA